MGDPSSIANLTLLKVLFLGGCQLGGSLPDIFQQLIYLTRLSLYENNLTGTIPPSLCNCSSLKYVTLSSNQLTGRLCENLGSKMPHLVALALSRNHIQGNFLDIPATLRVLDISSNNFSGKLPSVSNVSSIVLLILSYNSLVGSLHSLVCSNGVNMTQVLDLSNNHLSGDIPECWEKWSSLYFLSLRNNKLSGEYPNTLSAIPSLKVLNLWGNKFNGELTKSFWRFNPNLTFLDVSRNYFQGTLALMGIPETLKVVDLSFNGFGGSLYQLLCSNGTKWIEALNLGNNQLSGVIPECWEEWPSLVLLNLENNHFYGKIPRTLGSIPSLRLLNMCGNKISGRLPSSLMNLSYLKVLQLGRNNLVGSIPAWIGIKLTLLKILNLRSNYFY